MGGAPLGPGLCLPQALWGCPLLMSLTPALGRQDYSKSAPAEREETQFHVGLACCPFEKEVETAAAWRSVPGRGARFSSLEQAELGAGLYPQDPWIALRLENLSLCLYFSGLICVVFPKSSSSSSFFSFLSTCSYLNVGCICRWQLMLRACLCVGVCQHCASVPGFPCGRFPLG